MRMNPSVDSPTAYEPQKWSGLEEQDEVRIINTDGHCYDAVIETKTANSDVVWVRRQDIGTRHMLEHRDGIRIVPAY